MTVRESPLSTARATAKSVAENSVPVVPPTLLLVVMKQPPTVAVPLMLKTAGDAELSVEPPEGTAAVKAGRVAFEYAVISVQDLEDIVSAALIEPAVFRPTKKAAE